MKWMSSAGLCGAILIALSATVMLGWIEHLPLLIAVITGHSNMVFNTALCFFLSGNALFWADRRPASCSRINTVAGLALLLIAIPSLLQTFLQINPGIDQLLMSAWQGDSNPNPGRMSGNTGIGFIMSGICFLAMPYMRNKWVATPTQFLMFCVVLLGVSGLIGYTLKIEFLYSWYSYSRMAIHTSVAFTVLGFGLFCAWRNSPDFHHYYKENEDKKIFLFSLVILFYMGLISGLLGFIISANQNQVVMTESMQLLLKDKTSWLKNFLQHSFQEITDIKNNTTIQNVLAQNEPVNLSNIDDLLINTTFSAIKISNKLNKMVYASGDISKLSQDSIMLPSESSSNRLFVDDNTIILQSRIPMARDGNDIGSITLEWKLDSLGMNFSGDDSVSTEKNSYMICALSQSSQLTCVPSSKGASNQAGLKSFSGINDLNKLIQDSQSGLLTGTDTNNGNIMIAYRPLTLLNIGIVIKKDLKDIYSPLIRQLTLVLPFLFLVLLSGALILYRQILPLIRNVVQSKKIANDMNIRLNAIFNHVDQGIIVSNKDGIIEEFNPKSSKIFGYQKDEIIGRNIKCLIPEIANEGATELPAIHKDGRQIPIELSLTDMVVADEHSTIGIMSDITEKKLAEARLKESEAKFRSAFNSTAIGMAIISTGGQFIQVNDAFCHILGYDESELLMADFQSIIISQDLAGALKKRQELLSDEIKCFVSEERYHHKNGRTVWLQLTYSLIRSDNYEPLYFVVQIQDITEQKKSAEQLAYQAYYDALTGLANRLQLEHVIKSLINNTKRYHNRFAIFFLDLDRFKAINDQFGHQIGDEVLITVSERLLNAVRKTDTVARLGGDEFVIVVTDVTTSTLLAKFAEKIIRALADPLKINDQEFFVTTSLGVSVYPLDGKDSQTLIKNADLALYQAKEKGRNNYQFSSPEMGETI